MTLKEIRMGAREITRMGREEGITPVVLVESETETLFRVGMWIYSWDGNGVCLIAGIDEVKNWPLWEQHRNATKVHLFGHFVDKQLLA